VLLAVIAGTGLVFRWLRMIVKKGDRHTMDRLIKIGIVAALGVAVVVAVAVRRNQSGDPVAVTQGPEQVTGKGLPTLIDLGADKCIPCKMMAPILEEMKNEYKGRLDVIFIDVWKDPAPGQRYGINLIPTQIFFDPNGKELFRHEGFFSKEDILAKWNEFGVDLTASAK
jgi:thioredoxin 1